MAETEIRFHLDESVTVAIVLPLRQRGIDVTTSAEADLLEATDEEQLEFAASQGRVLITHDADFLALADTAEHAGIGYCHQRRYSVGELLQSLLLIHGCTSPEEMSGRVQYL
ncbi:MAG: DUF5615 family PIN-like protein [Planctomycetaceae bacterium]